MVREGWGARKGRPTRKTPGIVCWFVTANIVQSLPIVSSPSLAPPPVLPAAAGEIVSPGVRRRRGRGEGEGIGKGLDESKMEVEKGENFGM